MSAPGRSVFVEINSYPDCQYVATSAVVSGDLSSSTLNGKLDLAGNTAAANDRALFPVAGASALLGIYVYSGTAWALDPSFTVREGATVRVIRAVGHPQYIQTALTGNSTAAFTVLGGAPFVSYTFTGLADRSSPSGSAYATALPGLGAIIIPKGDLATKDLFIRLALSGSVGALTGTVTLPSPYNVAFAVTGTLIGTALALTGTVAQYGISITGALSDTTPSATVSSLVATLTSTNISETLTWTGSTVLSFPGITAGTYYDPVNGNDANAGTAALPKQTLPTAADSGVYYLAAGTTKQGQIADQTKTFAVDSYGVGPGPILDCTVAAQAAAWTKLGGYTNIYYHDIAVSVPNSGAGNVKVYAAGRVIQRVQNATPATALSALDGLATEAFYAADFATSTTVRVYLRNAAGTAPVDNRYRLDALEAAIYCRGSSSIKNITAYGGTCNNGPIVCREKDASDNPVIQGCAVPLWNKHAILICGGTLEENIALWACPNNANDACDPFVMNRDHGDLVDCLIRGNAAFGDPNIPSTTGINIGGIIAHANDSADPVGDITVSGNGFGYLTGALAFEGGPSGWTSMTFEDNLAEAWLAPNDSIFYGSNLTIRRNRIYGTVAKLVAPTAQFVIEDNILSTGYGTSGTTYAAFITPGGAASGTWHHTVTHNLFNQTNDSSTRRDLFYFGAATPSQLGTGWDIALNGNLATGSWTRLVEFGAGAGAHQLAGDNNVWMNVTANMFYLNGATGMPLATGGDGDYQGGWFGTWAATDPNSLQVTPTFDSYSAPHVWASHNPFTEAGGSPGISLAAGPRVSTFPGAAWATQQLYQAVNDALWLAGVHA